MKPYVYPKANPASEAELVKALEAIHEIWFSFKCKPAAESDVIEVAGDMNHIAEVALGLRGAKT